jgi:NitT/TauT family transport system substrate-binding protein
MATTRRQFLRDGAMAASAALVATPAIVSPARAADAITVVLPLGFAIAFFDTMNAAAGGHFANFGLDAKVIGANSGVQTVQLIASGQGTFGRGAPADIIRAFAAHQNAPIAIATVFQGCPFRVFSLKSKPILEPKDFAGKTVGLITLASPTGIYLDVMLSQAGLKPSDVERQPTGGTAGAIEILKQGRVDCFISTTDVEIALARMNEPVEVWDPGKYLPLPGQTYYAMPEILKARHDVAVRFLKACKASIDEMLAQPLASLITRAAKMFDIPEANNLDMAVAIVDNTIKKLLLADGRDKVLVNLPERWDGGVKALVAAHVVDIMDPSVLYTNEFVDAALKA